MGVSRHTVIRHDNTYCQWGKTVIRMARITIRLPDDLDERVEDYVGYGSKSAFYREAAEEKLGRDDDETTETAAEQ